MRPPDRGNARADWISRIGQNNGWGMLKSYWSKTTPGISSWAFERGARLITGSEIDGNRAIAKNHEASSR